ncbi:MAG: hypothetical protein HYU78_02315 [Rhodocyclales bacterium]|nr:hypothetical protein [Rhodocyclales bacterium]
MTTITIINPFSKAIGERDITGLTQAELDAYLNVIDDETLYALEGAGETPEEWLAAYVDHVGPEQAGIVILGS